MNNKSNFIKMSFVVLILVVFIYFIYYAFSPFFIFCSSKETSLDLLINNIYLCESQRIGIVIESDSLMRVFDFEGNIPDISATKESFYTFSYEAGIFNTSKSSYFVYGDNYLYEETTKNLYEKFN